MNLRNINESDIDILVSLGEAMVLESPNFREYGFDADKARSWFEKSIDFPNDFFCRLIEKDGKIIATMVAYISTMTFCMMKSAGDVGLYVLPEYRGTRAAIKLLVAYEDWLQKQNCKRSVLGITAGINDDDAIKFYKKFGYRHFGTIVIKEFP